MDRHPKEETPYYFAEGKRLFQVVARVPGDKGALGRLLDSLEANVDLVSTATYLGPDESLILSAVAEDRTKGLGAEKLASLLKADVKGVEVEVFEGREGMLVDTFHTGLLTGPESLMLMQRETFTRMLDRVHRLLGSGGEVLLFEEGAALGRARAEAFLKSLGSRRVRSNFPYLMSTLTAQGWGDVTTSEGAGDDITITVRDCFECSSSAGGRVGCYLLLGYLVGSSSAIIGKELAGVETSCRLRGRDVCEFQLRLKGREGPGRMVIPK